MESKLIAGKASPPDGRRTGRQWLATGLLLLAACASTSDPSTQPAVSLTLSASTVSVVQGDSVITGLDITRTGGFAGAVTMKAGGAPAGLTVVFAPSPLSATATSGTLTLKADTALAEGTYELTVLAIALAATDGSATLEVTVTAPPPVALGSRPASMALGPTAFAMTAGTTAARPRRGAMPSLLASD